MILAVGIGHGSKSKRPIETVTPLADKLKQSATLITDPQGRSAAAYAGCAVQHGAVRIGDIAVGS